SAQTATSPQHWDAADNWDAKTLPVNGDTVYVQQAGTRIRYGLEALTTVELFKAVFRGDVEVGMYDNDPDLGYPQYRPRSLKVGINNVEVQVSTSLIDLNFEDKVFDLKVYDTGFQTDEGKAVRIQGTQAFSSRLQVHNGNVVAGREGQECLLPVVEILGGDTELAPDCTPQSIKITRGTCLLRAPVVAGSPVEVVGGSLTVTEAIDHLIVHPGASVDYRATTITTLDLAGTVNLTRDLAAETVTNLTLRPGGRLVWVPVSTTLTITNYPTLDSNLGSLSGGSS
ncbi:MAG: hypothetical protein ACXABY_25040, partial [Candidatus Thorarchaeota archaeon]